MMEMIEIEEIERGAGETVETVETGETVETVETEQPKRRGRKKGTKNKVKVEKHTIENTENKENTENTENTEETKKSEWKHPAYNEPILSPNAFSHDWTQHPDYPSVEAIATQVFYMAFESEPNETQKLFTVKAIAPFLHNFTLPKDGEPAKPSMFGDLVAALLCYKMIPLLGK